LLLVRIECATSKYLKPKTGDLMPLIGHYIQAYGSWEIWRLPTFQLSFHDRGIYPGNEFRMVKQNIQSCNKSMQHKLEKLQ